MSSAGWVKSSYSHASGECVEVARVADGLVGVRDSKNPRAGVLTFPSEVWTDFLASIKSGDLHH